MAHFSRLGWSPKSKLLGVVVAEWLQADALPVAQLTVSQQ